MALKIDQHSLKPLNRDEISRRLEQVAYVIAAHDDDGHPVDTDGGEEAPKWIRPSELVRRMRPYLVYN